MHLTNYGLILTIAGTLMVLLISRADNLYPGERSGELRREAVMGGMGLDVPEGLERATFALG